MIISNVEIINFRNIAKENYDFEERNAIEGENHIGKTNALQAIYWALTDTLLDGSSDSPSIIPTSDRRAEVSVKITFSDGHTFTKSYLEKWTTSRGSSIESLTGHSTSFYFDDVPEKSIATAKKKIADIVLGEAGTINQGKTSIDLVKAFINPFYLFSVIPWKDLRDFIITICGDISDDDVFAKYPEVECVREPLRQNYGKTDRLAEVIKNEIANRKQEVLECKATIKERGEDTAPADDVLTNARNTLNEISVARYQIQNPRKSANPALDDLNAKRAKFVSAMADIQSHITEKKQQAYKDYSASRDAAENDLLRAKKKRDELIAQKDSSATSLTALQSQLETYSKMFQNASDRKKDLSERYKEETKAQFDGKTIRCPKCGTEIELDKEDWDSGHQKRLLDITMQGKAEATEMSKDKALIADLQTKISDCKTGSANSDFDSLIAKASNAVAVKQQIFDSIKPTEVNTSELDTAKADVAKVDGEIAQLRSTLIGGADDALAKYNADNKEREDGAESVINQKTVFDASQAKIKEASAKLIQANKRVAEEQELEDKLNDFIFKKLGLINASTKAVFPDIDFRLVQANIKEGSWDEVCYPFIVNKKTPFADGSGSEKITTAIAAIEDIRRYLGINPITLLFDEGETLDPKTIDGLKTESQIITTIVNDKYPIPTVVEI